MPSPALAWAQLIGQFVSLDLLLLVVLILLNAFFALGEMALVTARKIKLKQMAKESSGAALALKLAEHPERILSTVQIGITLVGVVTGVFVGNALGVWFTGIYREIEAVAQFAKPLGLATGVMLITVVSIFFGELIPKRLALVAPERIASAVALPMWIISKVAAPIVLLMAWGTQATLRLFGIKSGDDSKVSEEEIHLLVAEGHEQGVIDEVERSMVSRVLKFGDRAAESLMTPRNRILWLDVDAPLKDNLTVMRENSFSRYPVMRANDNDVVGVLEVKTLLDYVGVKHDKVELFRKLAKPMFVLESMKAMDLLEKFRDSEVYLAFVVDEYGDLRGLVTLNDVLAAAVGQSGQVVGGEDPPIYERADGSYLIDGALSLEDLGERLGLVDLPPAEERDYNSLAGLVMSQLGRVPHVGEHIVWRNLKIEVIDLDGPRVDKLLVTRLVSLGGE